MTMEQQQLLNNPKCSFSFLNASSEDDALPNLISSSSSSSWNMSPSSRNSSPKHSIIPTEQPIHNNIQICTSYIKSPDVTTRTPYSSHGRSTPSTSTTPTPQQLKTIMMPFSTMSTNIGTMNATEGTVDWIVGDSSYDETNYICSSTKIISKPIINSTHWKSMGGNCQVFADACSDITAMNTANPVFTTFSSDNSTTNNTANKRSKSKPLSRAKSESSALVETSSAINDAARVCGWTDVQHLCQLNPLDAAYRDIDGWTALHHACNRRPPVGVIQALTEACPEAVRWQDKTKGMTPLHYACRFKASKDVIQLLIDASLKSSTSTKTICSAPCKRGRTPLWYALRYDAPDGIMDLLLLQYPLGGILVDHLDESPLKYIWDRTISKLGKKGFAKVNQVIAAAAASSDAVISSLAQSRDKDVKDLYNAYIKAIKMVRAAYHALENILQVADDSDRMYPNILHALARVGACHIHPSLWDISTAIFSNQASLRDTRGNLPLHYAVAPCSVCFNLADELHKHSRSSSWEDTNPSIPVVASSSSMLAPATTASVLSAKTMALSLLNLYPEAAFLPDSTGRLPLHSALDSNNRRPSSNSCLRERFGWECDPNDDDSAQHVCGGGVIGRLVKCHPEALYKMDSLTGLYPFMMAAAYNYYTPNNNEIDLFAIGLAFDLLLESPGLLRTTDQLT